ncbi:hypothetical protein D3230_04305 [Leucobacter chromiireducens subsp. solipictus]|uniref:Uncharacterized protein n=1 Tax=Leucobacter chromiireducens subsp. solipictus TaxID=398235 RepID=A0ABS1SD95_9MICO|nr:hypothetical protein [Leucobacter chromiireducens subsp. solipictus]
MVNPFVLPSFRLRTAYKLYEMALDHRGRFPYNLKCTQVADQIVIQEGYGRLQIRRSGVRIPRGAHSI